ncbi:hypothetical protein EZJ19_07000 [Parasulfuritortus cantonensis]|uniref:Uncharacterized protein n=1 Tax=Parasulfuritortus cantonensis TaxID=2528202 RepID=A0A4R1BE67_9PROT|nr:hypothetical protein [Parasulfuritortus cantonensis]TCJ15357.1 hypothetical protein EZJ19_07000 [Parasulfuritortus cantonensis]
MDQAVVDVEGTVTVDAGIPDRDVQAIGAQERLELLRIGAAGLDPLAVGLAVSDGKDLEAAPADTDELARNKARKKGAVFITAPARWASRQFSIGPGR